MANYLDFLVAFDEHIAASNLGFVIYGHELHGIAAQAGLVTPGDQSAARWTGELVQFGYVVHGPLGGVATADLCQAAGIRRTTCPA